MNRFKFKAECETDIMRLKERLAGEYVPEPGNELEIRLTTACSLSEVREIMLSIPDGHVMADTVDTLGQYTGKRAYFKSDGEIQTDKSLLNLVLRDVLNPG